MGRMDLIQELERTRDETLKCFSLDRGDLARTYAPGKWSVGYILHHLSDSETVFFDRMRRVLSEPRPVLWVMDQGAWGRGPDYSDVPVRISQRVYGSVRNATAHDPSVQYRGSGDPEFGPSALADRGWWDEVRQVAR